MTQHYFCASSSPQQHEERFPACQVRVVRFYTRCCPPPPSSPPAPRQLHIAAGAAGLYLPAPDRSGHCRTSSASHRLQWALPGFGATAGSEWALPDFICQLQIAVGTAGLQPRLPDRSDFSRDCQIAVGTAGLHPRLPDRSGHCRTSAASARSQWAWPDIIRDCQIAAGTAGL
eukprot:s2430_g5.t1